jgi:hypothetical protein
MERASRHHSGASNFEVAAKSLKKTRAPLGLEVVQGCPVLHKFTNEDPRKKLNI